MENQGVSFTYLYHQALVNPKDLALADFEQLLARYPYSQPLHFAFERYKFLVGEDGAVSNKAILFANNASWLAQYVQLPIVEVPLVDVEDDDYVPYEDIASVSEGTAARVEDEVSFDEPLLREDKIPEQEIQERLSDEPVIPEDTAGQERTDKDALESLVQEGIGGGDYFALHAKDIDQQDEQISVREEFAHGEATEENISLYNDELMPYSFRWWLHKTRLEYADTYQPFASPRLPITNGSSFDPAELDRVILDQQIREHIIHLQSPEDKLSEEVKSREASMNTSNKTAEVIERFIREEPQIQPPQAESLNVENKARKSSEEQFDLVTETLASIYADQAMYVKAIEVYKKLILRFPEKKSYFAARIKELEEKLY